MEHLVTLGLIFLNLFMFVGTVDLFYYHIWKYKLHTRPESRYEHKLHMTFAFIMVPLAFLLYYQNLGGWALWAAVACVVAALTTEMLDVFTEGDSRASIGGLTTASILPMLLQRSSRSRLSPLCLHRNRPRRGT